MKRRMIMMLAAMLCIAMMPFGVFAETDAGEIPPDAVSAPAVSADDTAIAIENEADGRDDAAADPGAPDKDQAGEKDQTDPGSSEGTPDAGDPSDPEDPSEPDSPVTAKEFSLDEYSLRFKSFDVLTEEPLGNSYQPKSVIFKMIKAGGRRITWTAAKNDAKLDGYIVLRQKSGSDVYTEVAVKAAGKTSYSDKKAKSKDKAKYSYIVVGYKLKGDAVRITHCCSAKFKRVYQNPSGYVQIKDKISTHGLKYYTSPVLTDASCTKKDHIEAMIKTAYKYKGDRYVVCQSDRPGKGLDCSGLVMQACYGAGVDLWPSNPARHKKPKYEYESRYIAKMSSLKTVSYSKRKRGDLIFFANSAGTVIHVAIYLGNDRIIHSTSVGMRVIVSGMGGGAYGIPCKVKRIFN